MPSWPAVHTSASGPLPRQEPTNPDKTCRIAGGSEEAMRILLEVDVPPAYWDEHGASAEQTVPAPVAATAELDPNPDAGAPLGMPLS